MNTTNQNKVIINLSYLIGYLLKHSSRFNLLSLSKSSALLEGKLQSFSLSNPSQALSQELVYRLSVSSKQKLKDNSLLSRFNFSSKFFAFTRAFFSFKYEKYPIKEKATTIKIAILNQFSLIKFFISKLKNYKTSLTKFQAYAWSLMKEVEASFVARLTSKTIIPNH